MKTESGRRRGGRELLHFSTAVLGLAGMLALGLGALWMVNREPPAPETLDRQPLPQPSPVSHAYVGSQRCAECHQELFDRYQSHPMSQSMAAIGDESPLEDYSQASFSPGFQRRYLVERTGTQVLHHELLEDEGDTPIYDQPVKIDFVLGSGTRGRSFLINCEGRLFQSPITWYANGNRWDLAPGYQGATHSRFQRRVGDGCLYCHTGRLNDDPTASNHYDAEQPFAEIAIGCERCHGPGEAHVQKQVASPTSVGSDATIVNPSRLDAERREAVCNQCHLQGEVLFPRYGRGFADFRPGQYLDDTLVVFVRGTEVDADGNTKAVSQVQQMQSSQCFQNSQGKLGCTSCHDPHFSPAPQQRAAFYRERCLKCHGQQAADCALDAEQISSPPAAGSCIHCHMPKLPASDIPHTAQTDHRVLRRSTKQSASPTTAVNANDLELFGRSAERLSKRAADRARGLALVSLAPSDPKAMEQAEDFLLAGASLAVDGPAALDAVGDDTAVLEALGMIYQMTGNPEMAVYCWERVLELQPNSESTLFFLAAHYHGRKDFNKALEYLRHLIQVNPCVPHYHGRLAHILGQQNQMEPAIEAAKQGLKLDPTLTQLREWLVAALRHRGETEEAERQQKILDRQNAVAESLARPQNSDE